MSKPCRQRERWTPHSRSVLVSVLIVAVSIFATSHLSFIAEIVQPIGRGIPTPSPSVESQEWNANRIVWSAEKPFASFLQLKGVPVVLQASIASKFPKWTPSDVADISSNPQYGFYRSFSGVFGPYYDARKPMHVLPTIASSVPYEQNVSLFRHEIDTVFRRNHPPFYSLSADIASVNPLAESSFDLTELVSLMPSRSSVNIWMGTPGSVTPCHFDGYHNMYVQLSGIKKFVLFPPARRMDIHMFPFLHPSYGQCQRSLSITEDWEKWHDRVEVFLRPGELLYIPPFWIHEVTTVMSSVSVNVWTDTTDSLLLEQVFATPVPGMMAPFSASAASTFSDEEIRLQDIRIPFNPELFNNILSHRMIMGAVVVLEVLHETVGRYGGVNVILDVHRRYSPLIASSHLAGLPGTLSHQLVSIFSQWKPIETLHKIRQPPAWVTWFSSGEFNDKLRIYIKETAAHLSKLSTRTEDIFLASYVELIAFKVGGASRASSFIELLASVVLSTKGTTTDLTEGKDVK